MTEILKQPECCCQILRRLFLRLGCGAGAVSSEILCSSCQEELRAIPRALSYGEGTSFGLYAVACWASVDPDEVNPSLVTVRTRWIFSKVCSTAKQNQPLEGALRRAFRLAFREKYWAAMK